MTHAFEETVPGIWTGPIERIEAGNGEVVEVGAIWTDEDGVQVTLETPEEGMIPAGIVGKVASAMNRLASLIPSSAAA